MATTAQTVINSAQQILVDDNVRWLETELLDWINAGVRAIADARPDATIVVANLTLVAGTKQTLPADAVSLVDVVRNVSGRAVRPASMSLMDAQRPDWHTETAGATRNYFYDRRTPRTFFVYPPAAASAQVEIKYHANPALLTVATQNIPIGDEYVNALLDYVLYRAFSKDAEYTATNARAVAHKTAFDNALGTKTAGDSAVAPKETEAA